MLDAGYRKMQDSVINIKSPGFGEEPYHSTNIGMGEIETCARYLYIAKNRPEVVNNIEVNYTVGGSSVTEERMSRIFRMGFIIEEDIISWLRLGGDVSATQKRFTDPVVKGRFKGFCDVEMEKSYIIEIKSMNNDRFNDFKHNGLRETNINYFSQVNLYEFYNKTPEGYLLAYNKNTSDIHVEQIMLDKMYVAERILKARNIIQATSIFDVRCNRAEQDCGFCIFNNVCDTLPEIT